MEHLPPGRDSTLPLRLYRLLLFAYPHAFREEYASEMFLVFRDAYREASRKRGTVGVLLLCSEVFCDFLKTVCIEHGRSWIQHGGSDSAPSRADELALTLQFTLNVAQRTDIGRTRANNEDNLISVVPQDCHLLRTKGALFVVSDGIGDHSYGKVASELVVEKVRQYYYQDFQHDIPTALREAIKQANTTISQMNEAKKAQGANDFDLGATCVAAVLHGQMLYVANVGDSRVYVLHEGLLHQITRDHSLVAQLVERGEITPAEARTHEKPYQLYRWLGLPEVEADLFTEPVREGDTLILCTDGLYNVVEDEELRTIVEQYGPEESVQHLIARANQEGGPDNVTAVVVRVSAT